MHPGEVIRKSRNEYRVWFLIGKEIGNRYLKTEYVHSKQDRLTDFEDNSEAGR